MCADYLGYDRLSSSFRQLGQLIVEEVEKRGGELRDLLMVVVQLVEQLGLSHAHSVLYAHGSTTPLQVRTVFVSTSGQ